MSNEKNGDSRLTTLVGSIGFNRPVGRHFSSPAPIPSLPCLCHLQNSSTSSNAPRNFAPPATRGNKRPTSWTNQSEPSALGGCATDPYGIKRSPLLAAKSPPMPAMKASLSFANSRDRMTKRFAARLRPVLSTFVPRSMNNLRPPPIFLASLNSLRAFPMINSIPSWVWTFASTIRGRKTIRLNRRIRRSRRDPNDFVSFCFTDPGGEPLRQGEVHRDLQAFLSANRKALVELPRDHGKSTQVCARLLWELGHDPGLRIKIVCASEALAAERGRFIREAIVNNRQLPLVFPNLRPAHPWYL